jgi:PAS domain S-box-containing protein
VEERGHHWNKTMEKNRKSEKSRQHHSDKDSPLSQPLPIYRELFDLGPTPTAVFDLKGGCFLVNRAFCYQLGYDRENLLAGKIRFQDFFRKVEIANELIGELEERFVVRRREVQLKDNEGSVIPMLFSGRVLTYEGKTFFDVSLTNIAQHKRIERAFRRDHARMASLIESMTIGVFLVDNNEKVMECNLALANLLQIRQDAIVGESYQTLFRHFLSGALEPEVVQQALSRAVPAVPERPVVEIARKDKHVLHLEVAFFPVWDEDGSSLGWGGLVQDVTQARDRLAWKLEMLSILAHDIRTPLATLKGHTTALLSNYRYWDSAMVLDFLETIDRTTDKLVRQVDRSLALTRVEAGRLGLRPEAVHPGDLFQQAIERAAGVLGDIPVNIETPEASPIVRVDPARVEEVLINLFENAVRFDPMGKPIILRAEVEKPFLKISVIDHGTGISHEKQKLIFAKYERANEEGGGTGLGLFIARKIVEAHGGRIWVSSPPKGRKQGADFSFTIPLMPSRSSPETKQEDVHLIPDRSDATGIRVLIVEDEPDIQTLLSMMLRDEGYIVDVASDGPTTMDYLRLSPPSIVLLDWMLPGMSGVTVCRLIRRWSNIPILLITSKTSQADLVTALDAGADDYITKPFQGPELLARMRALIRRGERWEAEEERDRLSMEGLLIDFDAREVWMQSSPLHLTPTEFEILAYLARHRGQVLTYSQIRAHLWGEGTGKTKHDLFVHISRIRKKIEPEPEEPRFLVTRWGIGYVFLPK